MAKSANNLANDKYRAGILERIRKMFKDEGEDILQVAGNELAFPFVNELGSDEWVKVTISIPIGQRGSKEPYDGYELAQEFELKDGARKEREKKATEEKEKKMEMLAKKKEIAKKNKGAS